MNEEIKSMKDNDVSELVQFPKDTKPIGCNWMFKTKRDSKGNMERYKSRLVAKGYTQKEGGDYKETFSPVSSKDSLRIIMALVAHFDLELHQMDVKTTFLNGDIDEMIYMMQPENFVSGDLKNMVCKLTKSIYGLNNDIWLLHETKRFLAKNFEIKDLGEASYVLGIEIHRDCSRGILRLSQKNYIEKVLKRYGMQDCKPGDTPVTKGDKFSLKQCPKNNFEEKEMQKIPYSSVVGVYVCSGLYAFGYCIYYRDVWQIFEQSRVESLDSSQKGLKVVKTNWAFPTIGSGLVKLTEKLRRLKQCLKQWNKTVFGDIFNNLKKAEKAVRQAERAFDTLPNDDNMFNMNRCTMEWSLALSIEEDFWRQKGQIITKFGPLRDSGVQFFQNLLAGEVLQTMVPQLLDIPRLIIDDQGVLLMQHTSPKEVSWDIIEEDVVAAVRDFLSGTPLSISATAISIALIPKTFLEAVLLHFGFPGHWVRLVRNCVRNCWFSILINGSLNSLFKSTWGLRKGDPLSPSLFILASEYFSRRLNHLMETNKALAVHGSEGVSHLAYPDDVLIFTNSVDSSLNTIMEFLMEFQAISGQHISLPKSSLLCLLML
ncbi:UNVERIFIED_CONTAM: Retrovirus-related Pol polyprotein from transposon TNT 1-94 [Sesamum calycinum]|uniref:Retrovirus-related Pol polyprotein from transposon TNT 1-94 n=1 Tax=Sesamum calycinum TaxID=2727403 RepID=A0AAW2QK63_9LAMI